MHASSGRTFTSSRRSFAAHPVSVAAARRFLVRQVVARGLPSLADSAELAISELATNALLHAASPFTVVVDLTRDGALWLAVTDRSASVPEQRNADEEATGGRGVLLVAMLSRTWGVESHACGKTVWCEIADA